MSDFNRDTAVAHVEELCREHNIEWVTERNSEGAPNGQRVSAGIPEPASSFRSLARSGWKRPWFTS
jgi:hypothetical protein